MLRPRDGVCGGAKFFGSTLLQPVRSVSVSSERVFISVVSTQYTSDKVSGQRLVPRYAYHRTVMQYKK